MKLCDYGCGKIAKYQFKNGKWCCSSHFTKCEIIKKNTSKHHKGMTGKKHSLKSKQLMSQNHKGNKVSNETKKKISKNHKGMKGKSPWNKGKSNIYSDDHIKKVKFSIDIFKKKYPIFAKIEEMRYEPSKENNLVIQVHCKNHLCKNSKEKGGWFTPKRQQIFDRINSIETDGSYFYCCDECKEECPLFRLRSDPNIKKEELYTQEEYQTWRQQVLKREDYICEYCGEKANTIHHSRPQKLEPGFVLDPDFGVACCQECHYKYGHKTGTECSTGNLANKEKCK